MKLLKMNLRYVLIVMASVAMFSCSKEDGAIGPIGPAGATGQTGAAGPAGQDGADGLNGLNGGQDGTNGTNGADGATGATGTAGADGTDGTDGVDGSDGADGNTNVIAIDWFTIPTADWTINATSDTATASVDTPLITSSVIANSVILVYQNSFFALNNSNTLRMLPVVFENESTSFTVKLGELNFVRLKTDGSAVVPPGSSTSFRYVLIPPSASGKSSTDYTKMTYEEVMDHFDLAY